ncbi:MAG: S-layer homology domain-containing protein [Clostridia bacterium]|nr:S-layer homology domain-containing protein [Clostridia bacterium]
MSQIMKKVLALILSVSMLMGMTTGFAANVADGDNGKTLYFTFEYYNEEETEKITEVAANENFCLYVNYIGNPSVADDSMQGYNLLIGYDPDKVEFSYGDEGSYEGVLNTPSQLTTTYGDGVALVQGLANGGIIKKGQVVTSGTLFKLFLTAKTDLTETDLRNICLVETTGISGKENTYVIDGNVNGGKAGQFTVVQAPAISVGEVSGNIYTDSSVEDIKEMVQSFVYINDSGESVSYTQGDSEWEDFEIFIPEMGLQVGKNILTAKYNDCTCVFNVTVLDSIDYITVTTPPTKVNYIAFEKFDKTGMVVTATYESGATEDVTAQCVIDTDTYLTVVDTSWTVAYGNKTTTQEITVEPLEITKPVASSDVITYTGEVQTFEYSEVPDDDYVLITGETSGKDAKTYTATASLKDKDNTVWENGSTNDIQISWIINKAEIVNGINEMTKKYTTTYAELPSQENVTGINNENVSAKISWYTDALCEQPASLTSQITAEYTGEGQRVTLYYKATDMDNYKDYKGSVVVNVTGKDAGIISWKNLPNGLSKDGETFVGTYNEEGYTLSANMFAASTMAGSPLGEAQTIKINGEQNNIILDAGTYTVSVAYEDKDNKAQNDFIVIINPKSIEGAKVSLKFGAGDAVETDSSNPITVPYTGSLVTPEVTNVYGVSEDGYIILEDIQNSTVSAKDVSDDAYIIAVEGTGNYTGVAYGYWNITPAEIELKSAVVADKKYNAQTNDASVVSVSFDGLKGSDTLQKGVDYDIVSAVYEDKNASENANVNVTVALKDSVKNYTLKSQTVVANGKITKADSPVLMPSDAQTLLSLNVVQGQKEYSFNLSTIINDIPSDAGAVTYSVKEEGTYVKKNGVGIDGDILKVVVPTPQAADVTDSVVVAVSTNNFNDTDVVINFEFKNKSTVEITLNDVNTVYGDAYTVAGSYSNQPSSGYTWTYTYTGIEGTEYPTSDVKPVNAGKYGIKAHYEDNTPDSLNPQIPGHIGETTAILTIAKKVLNLSDGDVSVAKVYDGTTDPGVISGALGVDGVVGDDSVYIDMTSATASEYSAKDVDDDYTVSINGFILSGEDKDNYSIPETYNFNNAKITKQLQSAITINGSNENISAVYGDDINIVVGGGNGTGLYKLVSSDNSVVKLNVVDNNIWKAEILKIGEVTLTASKMGDANYEPSQELAISFVISPKNIVESYFEFDSEDKVFTGSEIKPVVTSQTLSSTTDYDVAYSNNVNVGTAAITVTAKGNYAGVVEKTFAITPKPLVENEFIVSGILDEYTYSGEEIKPVVSVAWGNIVLATDTDYDITYDNNINAGTSSVTISGKGNYSDSFVKTYVINPAPCTGSVIVTTSEPEILENTVLTVTQQPIGEVFTYQWKRNGNDIEGATTSSYTVTSYDIGANITVVVTYGGNYSGSVESNVFTVGKSILTGTVTLSGTTEITLEIENAPESEHYNIVWLRNGTEIFGATGTTYTVTNADKGCDISVQLVAIGDTYTGLVVSNTISIPAEAPSFIKDPIVSAGDKSLTVSFDVSANGSEIINYVIKVDEVEVAVITPEQTSYKITELENGVQYAIKVVAINSIGQTESNEVTATPVRRSSGGGSIVSTHKVSLAKTDSGKINTNVKNAKPNSTVVINVTPDEGYKLSKLVVLDKNGNEISLTLKGDEYTFIMPKSEITIDAEFVKIDEEGEDNNDEDTLGNFGDVKKSDYFYDAVKWATEKNITSGTSESSFTPNDECTRAQMVTFLWRAAGSPKATATEVLFADIDANSYYYDAVIWAIENGITSGISATSFDPEGIVNRAQSVTFLWRFASNPMTESDIPFEDVDTDSYYNSAVAWAVNESVTNGLSVTSFGPNDACTRAQIVTFIYRYFVK